MARTLTTSVVRSTTRFWLRLLRTCPPTTSSCTINLTGDPKVKARGIFGDYLGKSYTGDQKLTDGIAAWQKALQDYGKDQGFTVK